MTAATVTTRQVLRKARWDMSVHFRRRRQPGRLPGAFPSVRSNSSPPVGSCFRDGQPIQLGSRSLDILIALAERQGDVVDKHELIARVWPGINVDEGARGFTLAGCARRSATWSGTPPTSRLSRGEDTSRSRPPVPRNCPAKPAGRRK